MKGGRFAHFACSLALAEGLPAIWYHSPAGFGCVASRLRAWSSIAWSCGLRPAAALTMSAAVLAVTVAVGLGEAPAPLVGVGLSLGVSPGDVGASGVGLSAGSGAVSPKRLRIAWLPTYASPTGTPMHGGGGTTTPLWPPLLPV